MRFTYIFTFNTFLNIPPQITGHLLVTRTLILTKLPRQYREKLDNFCQDLGSTFCAQLKKLERVLCAILESERGLVIGEWRSINLTCMPGKLKFRSKIEIYIKDGMLNLRRLKNENIP